MRKLAFIYFFSNKIVQWKGGEEMNENILKEQLKTFLTKEERSIAYVARQINLSRTSLSLWIRGERELNVVVLEKIDNFIKEKAIS